MEVPQELLITSNKLKLGLDEEVINLISKLFKIEKHIYFPGGIG